LVLDAYFAVGPVFAFLKQAKDAAGQPLVHIVTREKATWWPSPTHHRKPAADKVRFVLVTDGPDRFNLVSVLGLDAHR